MNTHKCYYEECKKVYTSKYNLVRHINSSHLKIKKFFCVKCSKHFPNRQNLAVHEESLVCITHKASPSLSPSGSEFLLSEHFADKREEHTDLVTAVAVPPLPPVDSDRKASQQNIHLPSMPILIHGPSYLR